MDSFLWSISVFAVLVVFQIWLLVAVYKRWNFNYSQKAVEASQKAILDVNEMADKQEALVLYKASMGKMGNITAGKIVPDNDDVRERPRRRLDPISMQ